MVDTPGEKKEAPKSGAMGFTVERVNAFSDGVFAIAITLLVLSIAVPAFRGSVTESKLAHGLAELWPHFFAYILSFLIIAMFWLSHHLLFTAIQRVDKPVLWLNIFYLLLICFIPYPTNLLALFGETTVSTVLYASVMAGAALLQGLMGLYATRGHRLVDDEFDLRRAAEFERNSFLMSAVFIISIGISFVSAAAAQFSWILLFLIPLLERLVFRRKAGKTNGATPEAA
ncbi:MAG: TMEM175 family protein [Actinomycetota bacterium]